MIEKTAPRAKTNQDAAIAHSAVAVRVAQLMINERYKAGAFRVPIHLALGHEAIAVAVSEAMTAEDQLVLPHRNLHYNLARGAALRAVIDEFLMRDSGLAGGRLGSMNLRNAAAGVIYTSSILGNNLGVGAGVSLANALWKEPGLTFIVTGDGAMEEGAFYEAIGFLSSMSAPTVVVIENNGWSLATRIEERRCAIDLGSFAETFDAGYTQLNGNDPWHYRNRIEEVRARALARRRPELVEAKLSSLGDWRLKTEEFPEGKYINYHAGPAPDIDIANGPILRESDEDPLYVMAGRLGADTVEAMARDITIALEADLQ